MGQHTNTTQYFSGQGIVLISERNVDGTPVGFRPVGNVSSLTVQNAIEEFEHKESYTGTRGEDLVLTTDIGVDITAVLESFSKDNLALALYGSSTNVAADTAVAKNIPAATLGLIYPLDKVSVSNVVVKDGATGTITYVVDVNYELDAATGSIRIMTTAEQTAASAANLIADQDELDVTFDHAAQVNVDAQVVGRTDRILRFEGLNTADTNKAVVVEIYRFSTAPLAELALINDEIAQFELSGKCLSDDLRPAGQSKFFKIQYIE